MASVGKELAEQIIQQDGYYADDPRVHQVIKYRNAWAILYAQDVQSNRYRETEYVQQPQVIWEAK